MTRFLTRMTALTLSGFCMSSLWAAEITFSGAFDGDVGGYYKADPESKDVDFFANHELDLTAGIQFTDKVGVEIYATTITDEGDPENRWTGFAYDGFIATVALTPSLSILFGDLTYSAGAFSYYGYDAASDYGSVMAERGFRGIQVDAFGLSLAVGADTKSGYGAYAAYTLGIGSSSIVPFISYTGDQASDSKSLRGGVDANLVFGEQAVNLTAGILKDKGTKITPTIKVEPALAFGSFTLAATYFLAILDDEDPTEIDVPEYTFVYVEPGFILSPIISVGLPLEFHTMTTDKDASLEEFWVVPTVYLDLTEGVRWSVWGQASLRLGDDVENDDPYFGFGSELSIEF